MEISIAIIISSVTGLILIGVQIGSFTRSFISRSEWIREKQTFRDEFQEMEQKILDSEKLQREEISKMYFKFDEILISIKQISEDVAFFRGSHYKK